MVSQDGANGSKTGVNGSKTGVNGCKRLPFLSFQIQRHIWLTVSILSLAGRQFLTRKWEQSERRATDKNGKYVAGKRVLY